MACMGLTCGVNLSMDGKMPATRVHVKRKKMAIRHQSRKLFVRVFRWPASAWFLGLRRCAAVRGLATAVQ